MGILWSVDALFCETEDAIETWKSYGAKSVDMESSAVYLLGNLFKIPSISILWDIRFALMLNNGIFRKQIKSTRNLISYLTMPSMS